VNFRVAEVKRFDTETAERKQRAQRKAEEPFGRLEAKTLA
jgi:hypothetical protein